MTVHDHADIVRIDPELTALLMDHSPRLNVNRPTLLRHDDSPTGWIVVIPGPPALFAAEGEPVNEFTGREAERFLDENP